MSYAQSLPTSLRFGSAAPLESHLSMKFKSSIPMLVGVDMHLDLCYSGVPSSSYCSLVPRL